MFRWPRCRARRRSRRPGRQGDPKRLRWPRCRARRLHSLPKPLHERPPMHRGAILVDHSRRRWPWYRARRRPLRPKFLPARPPRHCGAHPLIRRTAGRWIRQPRPRPRPPRIASPRSTRILSPSRPPPASVPPLRRPRALTRLELHRGEPRVIPCTRGSHFGRRAGCPGVAYRAAAGPSRGIVLFKGSQRWHEPRRPPSSEGGPAEGSRRRRLDDMGGG
jgi:hypothetical protein